MALLGNIKGPTGLVANYSVTGLKSASTAPDLVFVTDNGKEGLFQRDLTDTTSAENMGLIIVDNLGKRWKRTTVNYINVKWFGAKGDGTTDDTQAINNAKAVSNNLYFPDVATYIITSTLNLADITITGQYKYLTVLKKKFNGTFLSVGNNVSIENVYLDGNGANYTGKGIVCLTGTGRQNINNCKITNFEDNCIYFDLLGGSQSNVSNCEIVRYNSTINSNLYAIKIEDSLNLSAVPRKFNNVEFNGLPSFSFGGSSDTFINNSFIGGLDYSSNSRAVLITNCRIANQSAFTISGANNTITNCNIYPQLTLSSGTDNCVIANNSYNQLPVIDNSGNNRNQITHFNIAYTCVLGSGGIQPVLGNGSLIANYSRNGSVISVVIELTLGSTTMLGTGGLSFRLPTLSRNNGVQTVSGIGLNIAGGFYTCVGTIPPFDNNIYLIRDTTSSVTFNSPATFVTGNTIRCSFSYSL